MKVLIGFGLIIIGLLLALATLGLLGATLAFAQAGSTPETTGGFLGSLLTELILIWAFQRLFKSLRAPGK